jgi:prepilin-type N-terminal cleavage/methylation domain-containing protein
MSKSKNSQAGFTIIEIMIAAGILSVILVMATVVIIGIGNLYYKGVNEAAIQDQTRTIVEDVSRQIAYGGSATPSSGSQTFSGTNVQAECIGSTRYSYIIGNEVGSGVDTDPAHTPRVPIAMWRDSISPGVACAPIDITSLVPMAGGGTSMVAPNSRITSFSVTAGASSLYTIDLELAYGDADLLSSMTGSNVTCNGSTGDQYCATANLTTQVAQRL